MGKVLAALLALALAPALSSCSLPAQSAASPTPKYLWHGAQLVQPVPMPALTLTDDNNTPYNVQAETAHHLVLVYFGYTHCPDACPADMATLTVALHTMTPAQRAQVTVIFVTTDPRRDTPAVLKTWLSRFDSTYVGLTGTQEQLIQAQLAFHLPLSQLATPDASGNYGVEHAAFVLAFSPQDAKAHISYPQGVSSDDEAQDFVQLLAGTTVA